MSKETKIAISTEFLESLIELPKGIQGKAVEFFSKFMKSQSYPGIKLEKINIVNGKQLYSIRIDRDYRGIMYKDNQNIFHLLWIEHHNEVYDNIDLKKDITIDAGAVVIDEDYYKKHGITRNKTSKLFSTISDNKLISFGVERRFLPIIREIKNINSLQAIKNSLPDIVYSNLEFATVGAQVQDINSANDFYKKELSDILIDDVLLPGIEHPELDQEIKGHLKNTIESI
jgi:mRNA-degrading endonuclease RelE of RelBE toxin-antitoxin system